MLAVVIPAQALGIDEGAMGPVGFFWVHGLRDQKRQKSRNTGQYNITGTTAAKQVIGW